MSRRAARPSHIERPALEPAHPRRLELEAEAGALVVSVAPGSLADTAGLRPGDVIEQIGGDPVKTAAQASRRLDAASLDKGVRLRVRRGEYGHFIMLRAR